MNIRIYVEGGGFGMPGGKPLRDECRQGFSCFFRNAGLKGRMPRVLVCGGRDHAFEQFSEEIKKNKKDVFPMLLVDYESSVSPDNLVYNSDKPWRHLKNRIGDGWDKPPGATDDHVHLMVQCMEAWIVVDKNNLAEFYRNGFDPESLPSPARKIEEVPKEELIKSLENATKDTETKGKYHKGNHSFKLLATTDPKLVTVASPSAKRLIKTLFKIAAQ